MAFPIAFASFAGISLFLYAFSFLMTRLRYGRPTRQQIWAFHVVYTIAVAYLAYEFFVAPHIPTHHR
jgi:hypothetical protein